MTAIVELKDAPVKVNNGFDTEKIILDHVNLTIREGDFLPSLVEMVPENRPSSTSLQEPLC